MPALTGRQIVDPNPPAGRPRGLPAVSARDDRLARTVGDFPRLLARRALLVEILERALNEGVDRASAFRRLITLERALATRRDEPAPAYSPALIEAGRAAAQNGTIEQQIDTGFAMMRDLARLDPIAEPPRGLAGLNRRRAGGSIPNRTMTTADRLRGVAGSPTAGNEIQQRARIAVESDPKFRRRSGVNGQRCSTCKGKAQTQRRLTASATPQSVNRREPEFLALVA